MTDQQALEYIDQRMTEARDAAANLVTHRAIIDQTRAAFNEAGVLSGPLPERARKLAADLADVTAERDRLRADLNALYNIIADFDPGENPDPDGFPARLRELLTARTLPAPDVAPGGVEWNSRALYVSAVYMGRVVEGVAEWSVLLPNGDTAARLPNEPTARAVLLALAGQDCGRVEFGLRENAKVADLYTLRAGPLQWVYDDLMIDSTCGPTTWTTDPADVRAWVDEGPAALTIKAVSP